MRARAKATFHRYRGLDIEYAALKVVGRGIFLAVILMLVFLFFFDRATDLIAGQNEIVIPTTNVSSSVDLGALVRGAFDRTSASVVSALGVLALLVSAVMTAHALRGGTHKALGDDVHTRLVDPRTLLVAVAVPLTVLACWILTLGTSLRTAAWSALLGAPLQPLAVNAGKVGLWLAQWALLTALAFASVWLVRRPRRPWATLPWCLIFGLVALGANAFLLYTYVGALLNPDASSGVVLVLTLLVWVNVVVRAYLICLCWLAEGDEVMTGKRTEGEQERPEPRTD